MPVGRPPSFKQLPYVVIPFPKRLESEVGR
jgi:hypothetical protein